MQANDNCFKRFDIFNNKYNPMGKPELRQIFLKFDNFIEGRYLAELTKEYFKDLSKERFTYVELRISINGKDTNEW